jgi:hypothetical protein
VKADGTFRCWGIGGSPIATDAVAPPGVLRSAYPLGSNTLTWLLQDGTFVDESGNETQGVLDFDVASNDVCLISSNGTASCSRSGAIEASVVVQVAVSAAMRCALQQSGEVSCDDRQDGKHTLNGPYLAIAVASQILCAVEAAGAASCIDLAQTFANGGEPSVTAPLAGVYERIAMTDTTVCAISQEAALDCAQFSGAEPLTQPGSFVDVDGGDFTFGAIRADGSVASWVNQTGVELPAGW